MDKDGFAHFLRPYIDKGIPFKAYWHPKGMGLLRLDEVMVPRIPPCELRGDYSPGTRCKTVTKSGVRRWEINLLNLRRNAWTEVITVEYDGKETKIEGGELCI